MLFSAPPTIPSKGGVMHAITSRRAIRGSPSAKFAILLLPRVACSSLLLACLITSATALDLSLPRDILDEGRRPPPERGALMGEEFGSEGNPPEVSLYTHNVKETIKRRMQGAFPKDGAGRVICGEASYAMTLRADGSIDRLEVIPVRPSTGASGSLESFFVQPTAAYRNAGNAQHRQRVETDEENLEAFAQAIADRLHSIAPYPARLQRETTPPGPNDVQPPAKLVLIAGSIGVKCTGWEVGRQ